MTTIRRGALASLVLLATTACLATSTPSPSPTPIATPEPTASPTPLPSPTAQPTAAGTPGLADVPRFAPGSPIAVNAPGLRLRSQPGSAQRVITTLAADTHLYAGVGPVFIEGNGWYLVHNADATDPTFGEGWVAAGFQPDPFLVPASFPNEGGAYANPYIAGFAHDASGEYGPVLLPDGDVSIRWIAAPLTANGCSFAVDLRPGSGEAVPAIRSTVGGYPAPGELYAQFFDQHPELDGDLFVVVTSDCSWALTFVLNPPPLPSPSATPAS
jgi:hypothetical protein